MCFSILVMNFLLNRKGNIMDEEQEDYPDVDHICEENLHYYEFYEDGHRYHGYECGICGELLQTG